VVAYSYSKVNQNYIGPVQWFLTLWHPAAFGIFVKKKHRLACGFAREFLRSGKRYRPGQKLKRCGKSCSLHSKKFFWLGDLDFLWVTS